MPISGFGLGGMASGITQAADTINQNMQLASTLKLQVAREQQNQKHSDYMKLRSDLVNHMGDVISKLRIAHPGWTDQQLAANPAVVGLKNMLSGYDKNLKLPESADSVVAGFVAMPSEVTTERALAEARDPYKGALEASEISKNKAAVEETDQEINLLKGGSTSNAPTNADPVKSAQANIDAASPEDKFLAGRVLAGDTQALSGFGFSKVAGPYKIKINKLAADMAIAKKMKPEDVNANVAQFMGQKAGATTLSRREANVIGASTTAQMTASRVVETSDAIDRTQYPTINSILLAAKKGTGDENVIRNAIAISTFVNNYAQAIGAGNSRITDSARKEAMQNLEAAWSKGQVKAAIDQMLQKELPSEIKGAKKGVGEFLNQSGGGGSQGGAVTVHGFTFTPSSQ